MNYDHIDAELLDLGAASVETRGGAMGYEDQERTLWLHAFGLCDD
jgi:hypothetical protein